MSLNVQLAVSSRDASVMKNYSDGRAVGQGTFGVVLLSQNLRTREQVAIKKVIQDPRFRNRELSIMKSVKHFNVVALKDYYYTRGEDRNEDVFLNVVMEYVPDTLHRCCRNYVRQRQYLPIILVKLFMFQLLRSIGYLHLPSVNVCHRDIKPHNVLVDESSGELKICDFGSAKRLTDEANVAYICSRYYRAPELIFGNQFYSTAVDIWSVGCIFVEMLLGEPVFRGDDSMDQLTEIAKILGSPTSAELQVLNTQQMRISRSVSEATRTPWSSFLPSPSQPEAYDLCDKLLKYVPTDRIKPFDALMHPFFAKLKAPETLLPNGKKLPAKLFCFTSEEVKYMTPEQKAYLVESVEPSDEPAPAA